jgi:hypothetical protein
MGKPMGRHPFPITLTQNPKRDPKLGLASLISASHCAPSLANCRNPKNSQIWPSILQNLIKVQYLYQIIIKPLEFMPCGLGPLMIRVQWFSSNQSLSYYVRIFQTPETVHTSGVPDMSLALLARRPWFNSWHVARVKWWHMSYLGDDTCPSLIGTRDGLIE